MAKMSITGDVFRDALEAIDKAGGDLRKAADDALTETGRIISDSATSAASPYFKGGRKGYATGEMAHSLIKKSQVSWEGNTATVAVGFDLKKKGAYHSIFVMYGTPRIAKDTKLYSSIKGAGVKKRIIQAQGKVFEKYTKLGGK